MIVRLVRIVPLLIVLAVLALIMYMVITYRHSPVRAKEILIKMFMAVSAAVSVFFGLVCLYAWFDGNGAVLDIAGSFLATGLIALGITYLCRAVFYKHNPAYKKKPAKTKHFNSW